MRRSLGKIPYPVIGRATATSSSISAAFSTSSAGGGSGRGRGQPTRFQFTVDSPSQTESDHSKNDDPSPPPHSHGRGRGKPLTSSSVVPSFSSFVNNDSNATTIGRGRGFVPTNSTSAPPRVESGSPSQPPPKPSFLFAKDEKKQHDSAGHEASNREEKTLMTEIVDALSGAGRGKPTNLSASQSEKPTVENRHIRQRQSAKSHVAAASDTSAMHRSSPSEQLSQEDKVKKAVGILSRGDEDGGRGRAGVRGGRGARGGRGRGRGRGRESFGGRGRGDDRYEESDDEAGGLYIGDPAEEEKLAQKLGPEMMNKLAEGFEEMSSRVLPSPMDDEYLDAYHTNLSIECEPEYLMEEFGTNPDIDDKPPIPLRDALEKMKPFLMSYIGIESQEEWEEIMSDTMKTVPLMKEIVDHYSGPDRVTAKKQQEELERVAKTLPASAPASVKKFTDRAVLSLQSNPGWGWDKKCQFMDKLVMEVSQQYK